MQIRGICRVCERREADCVLARYEGNLVVFCYNCAYENGIKVWDKTLA